jgi:hypothetical protein
LVMEDPHLYEVAHFAGESVYLLYM